MVSLEQDPPICASLYMTPSHWLRLGLANFLLVLNYDPPLPISASQVARITGVSHHAQTHLCCFKPLSLL
jgi:hypothetical protein